ncbi:MAG: hypothetical protein MJ139_06640, partial [Limosilactobacillus sp.]|nr:hypothetical protein [Limosilactobacillus sp.]
IPGTVKVVALTSGQIKAVTEVYGQKLTTVAVTLPTGDIQLTAPADWTPQADGTYQIQLSLHDVAVIDETGNDVTDTGFLPTGTYTLKLTAQGIQKLQASNPDILLTSTLIDDGTLTITPLVLKLNQYGVKKPYNPQTGYSAADAELLNTKTISLTGHEGVKGVNLATPDTQFAHLAVVAINNIDVALAGTNAVKAGLQPTSGKVLQSFAALDSGDPFSYTDATAELTPQDQASLVNYANGDVGINFYYDLPVDVPITYHDDTDKDNVPANKLTSNITKTLTPYVNEGSYTWNVTVPSGYQLATNQAATVDYSAADQGITVHLTHKTVTVTPDNPKTAGTPIDANDPNSPKYPKDVDEAALNQVAKFTVTYTGAGEDTTDTQQVKFHRNATVDEVT